MANPPITASEYDLHLKDLCDRLKDCLAGGGGDSGGLLREAEELLGLAEDYPEVMRRHEDVSGLVGELLARREQQKFMNAPGQAREPSGCLLAWLPGRRR